MSACIYSVCLFLVIFIYLDDDVIPAAELACTTGVATVLGYALHRAISSSGSYTRALTLPAHDAAARRTVWDDMRTYMIVLTFGAGLSPLLMTLTATISSDTLYMMCFFLLLANLLFHDYGASTAA